MAHTNYWRELGPRPTDDEWDQIKTAARKLFKERRALVCRESDTPRKAPAVNNRYIAFNGRGEDGHETFVLQRAESDFSFCKTAGKPYDIVVVELLREVKRIVPDWLHMSSDGDGDEEHINQDNPNGLVFP